MHKRLFTRTAASGALVALAVAALYLFADRYVSIFTAQETGAALHHWAASLSLLAHHTLVFGIAAAGLMLAACNLLGRRPAAWAEGLLFICLATLAAIALVESVKFLFGRCRPELLFQKGQYGFTWLTSDYQHNSFPSGHTTRIFALGTSLFLLSRRFGLPALLLAALVGVSRVIALKHYPSDVLAGAWLGATAACWAHALWQQRRCHPLKRS